MTKVRSFFLVLLLLGSVGISSVSAQAIAAESGGVLYLNSNGGADEVSSSYRRGAYVGPHELGETVTDLLNKFEMKYTYYKPGNEGAYATEERIVTRKPIYKAVKKVVKHYEKEYKKDRVNQAYATAKVERVLNVALRLTTFYTEPLERKLKKLKDVEDIEEQLMKIKFKE